MTRRPFLTLLLLWLVGNDLRTVLLGVPPTLPTLHHALGLSYSAGGLLTSLPVLVMALGAIPGAFLISRVGPRSAVAIGLALVTLGAGVRSALPLAAWLFLFTIVLSLGIAVSQPAMPSLAQSWFPGSVGRAVAIYSNGLLIGEVIAASVTLPLLLEPFGWQVALAAWAIPSAVVLLFWMAAAPPAIRPAGVVAWRPDWRSPAMLRLGFLMGSASLIYFGMNTWIPDTLDARHAHTLISVNLAVLNAVQIPVSLLVAIFGQRLLGRRWPYIMAALISVAGVAGYAVAPTATSPYWVALAGVGSSFAFVLNLGLPALLAPSEVARASGFMFTIGYGTAFFGPALGGVLWDASGHAGAGYAYALLPILLAALAMFGLGLTLPAIVGRQRAQPVTSAAGS